MKKTKLCQNHPPTTTARQPIEEDEEEEELDTKKPYIVQLPDHIIVDILCKIPIRTLIQCRCVCKSWRCLLSDPHFTQSLFSRTPSWLLVSGFSPNGHFLVDLDSALRPNDVALKLSKDLLAPHVDIVGSCNGFLCALDCHSYRRFYIISNPITGESLSLPRLINPKKIVNPFVSGFGFSPISNVFKVVMFMNEHIRRREGSDEWSEEPEEMEVMVMTVGSGIWRSTGNFEYPLGIQRFGVYLNGFLHWIGQCSKRSTFLCAFDIENECFQQLPLPPFSLEESFDRCNLSLRVFRGCLSLIEHSGNDVNVWLMKDYGIKESWTKEYDFGGGFPEMAQVVKFTEEGQFLLLHRLQLQAYTPGRTGFVRVEVNGIPPIIRKTIVHIPSFASLEDVIRGLELEGNICQTQDKSP